MHDWYLYKSRKKLIYGYLYQRFEKFLLSDQNSLSLCIHKVRVTVCPERDIFSIFHFAYVSGPMRIVETSQMETMIIDLANSNKSTSLFAIAGSFIYLESRLSYGTISKHSRYRVPRTQRGFLLLKTSKPKFLSHVALKFDDL